MINWSSWWIIFHFIYSICYFCCNYLGRFIMEHHMANSIKTISYGTNPPTRVEKRIDYTICHFPCLIRTHLKFTKTSKVHSCIKYNYLFQRNHEELINSYREAQLPKNKNIPQQQFLEFEKDTYIIRFFLKKPKSIHTETKKLHNFFEQL